LAKKGTFMERKLAAILAADVAGYSRLMELDEAGTFERLKTRRIETVEPAMAAHRGSIFKLMGDGLLAEFASVVDAVECAVDIQRGMAERNAGLPEDQRIDVRIGVNLGEVIVEGQTGTARASISPRVFSSLPIRAAFAFPARWRTRSRKSWRSASSRWARKGSRTSASRSLSIG
jgi:class 3 adenylate cyclase